MATSPDDTQDGLRPEYDFRSLHGVERGRYAGRRSGAARVVRLAEDLADQFPDDVAVNEALREYLRGRASAASAG